MLKSKTADAFDEYAEEYDKWFDSPEGKALFEMEVEAVRLLMKDLKHPYLEIGVGTGRFAKELGIEFGIDPSRRALEFAEKRGIKVKIARGEELPFEDQYFGGVFVLFTLCFVEDVVKVLSEAGRVLKQDGRLIIGIINSDSNWGKHYLQKKEAGHAIYKHARFYGVSEISGMIEKAGLSLEVYSSALLQPPSERPVKEAASNELIEDAGFVCIRAGKSGEGHYE